MSMKQKPNFTPRAQQAISQAKKIAEKYNSPVITLEHLFYGMLKLSAGIVHEILFLLGVDAEIIKNEIERNLEQMRAIDNDIKINVALANKPSIGIDTIEDYVALKKIMEYKS